MRDSFQILLRLLNLQHNDQNLHFFFPFSLSQTFLTILFCITFFAFFTNFTFLLSLVSKTSVLFSLITFTCQSLHSLLTKLPASPVWRGRCTVKSYQWFYVTWFMYWPLNQSLYPVYEVSRISLRLFCNLKISLSHTFGQGPKMSTLAHILIVDLGRHLEWFLELAPVRYIMLHILYIIIEL